MTTLQELPPDPLSQTDRGLYCIDSEALAPLLARAMAGGYDVRHIDLKRETDKRALLDRLADALDFPTWFGHNWDALADCLGDLGWLPDAPGRVFVFDGLDRSTSSAKTLLDILAERADDLAADGPPLWLLVVTPPAPTP
jgi:RNAse (barnase) inhibitor barstar